MQRWGDYFCVVGIVVWTESTGGERAGNSRGDAESVAGRGCAHVSGEWWQSESNLALFVFVIMLISAVIIFSPTNPISLHGELWNLGHHAHAVLSTFHITCVIHETTRGLGIDFYTWLNAILVFKHSESDIFERLRDQSIGFCIFNQLPNNSIKALHHNCLGQVRCLISCVHDKTGRNQPRTEE